MQLFLLFLTISGIIFLFTLYTLGREDYSLMRKNISPEILFNIAFSSIIVSLLGARILYVAFHWSPKYLNPLVFLAFPYFPGLSMTGGIVAALLFVFYIARLKKYPKGRLLDIFSLSLLSAIPIAELGNIFIMKNVLWQTAVVSALLFAMFLFFIKYLFKFLLHNEIKEGNITALFLLSYAVVSIFYSALLKSKGMFLFFRLEDFFTLLLFFISLIILLRLRK